MKLLVLFSLLFSGFVGASELKVDFKHTIEGDGHFSATVYELVLPGDNESPLWDLVHSLQTKIYTSEDGTFTFTCAQAQVSKSVFESRCTIEVKSLDQTGHIASSQTQWATLLTDSKGFKNVFAPTDALIKINIKDRFKIREITKQGETYFYLTFEK